MDLAVRNGIVVTAAGSFSADLGIDGGRFVQVGGIVPSADREIDATGLLVLPGVVDIHTHLAGTAGGAPPIDDFARGSRAAAAGGVTTVCDFAFQRDGEGLTVVIERSLADAQPSLVDYAFHTVVRDPSEVARAEVADLAKAGFAGLKVFMSRSRFTKRTNDYVELLRASGRAGVLTAIHAEDQSLTETLEHDLLAKGRRGVEWYTASRPPLTEEIAVRRACAFAATVDAPVYLVHLSCAGAFDAVRDASRRGWPVYAETRPIYLYLDEREYQRPHNDGANFVGEPPLRGQEDLAAVWRALADRTLSTVCTDHIPYPSAVKMDPAHTFATIPRGMSNLETLLPMLYSEGVRSGRITIERLVEVLCTNTARLAGLSARKGTISPGLDADLVLFDPNKTRTIHASEMQSAADYEVFEGREITGWPVQVLSRGEVIFRDGAIVAATGRGHFVPRATFQAL